jgi:hypothetical protein
MKNLFDKLFGKKKEIVPETKPEVKPEHKVKTTRNKKKQVEPILSSKEKATMAGEPYISIIKVEIDPNNIHNGMFELDWNDKFVINLIKAGYKIKDTDTDMEIVDRWFTQVCRNIALEIYEQVEADPLKREDIRIVNSRDIGNGRSEVS